MSDLTPEKLAELRRLLNECQPWQVVVKDLRPTHNAIWLDSNYDDPEGWRRIRTLAEIDTEDETIEVVWGLNDALLIAGSLNLLPALLDAAQRLAHMTDARDNARAEVERLTGQIEAAKRIGLGTHLGRTWPGVLNDVLRALDEGADR